MKIVDNKKIKYLTLVNLVGFLVIIIYLFQNHRPAKSGFIVNQIVFEQFNGKKEMERKLEILLENDRKWIDSLENIYRGVKMDENTSSMYNEKLSEINVKEKEFSARYTNTIWTQINQYIGDYGKDNEYDFIYGATGNGSLMYGNEAKNLTNEVVIYMNKKYEGK